MTISELGGGVCRYEYPYHVATLHWTLIAFSTKIIHTSKFYQGTFHFNVHQGITWWSPPAPISMLCFHIAFNVDIFSKSYALAEILWIRIFILVFIKGSCCGAHRCDYLYLLPHHIQL
jgi:hypothetical protein